MDCPTCQQPLTIHGTFWFCGRHDPPYCAPVETPQPELVWLPEVVCSYPFPLARRYHALREAATADASPVAAFRQLNLLKDVVETLVKYLAVVALAARLDRHDPPDPLDQKILENLVRPSLGTWSAGILQPLVKAPGTRSDPRMAPLVHYADNALFTSLQEFTNWRNLVLGHGLTRSPLEDRADLDRWLPAVNDWLAGAGFLADWPLLEAGDPPRLWMGAEAPCRTVRHGGAVRLR
ncbi:MAG: hypothetical protein HYU66_19320 [Armatimonadetes bacterium]|nr:hypothetical protein [Armatimonadota bacterium]